MSEQSNIRVPNDSGLPRGGDSQEAAGLGNVAELHRLLIESVTNYAIFVLDPKGTILSWNPGAERLKGYTTDEIIGRNFSVFYPKEDVQAGKPQRELATAERTGRVEDEGWRLRKNGSRFWANVVITALRGEDGTLLGFAKITRDLTARRNAEEQARQLAAEAAGRLEAEKRSDELARLTDELQQQAVELESQTEEAQSLTEEVELSNTELQTAVEEAEVARDAAAAAERFVQSIVASINEPLIVQDASGVVRYSNPTATALFGSSPGEKSGTIVGRPFWDVFSQLRGTSLEQDIRQASVERRALSVESFVPRRAEWWATSCYPLPDGGLTVQLRNVTARKQAEEAARYLVKAGEVLGSSLDLEATLNALAQIVVPDLADWCSVDIVSEDGSARQLAVAHADPSKAKWARELNSRYSSGQNVSSGVPNVLRTGKPELHAEITDELLSAGAVDEEHLHILRQLGLRSAIVVPLRAKDQVLGALTLVSAESGRRYTEADLALAMELARRAALAVENARLHRATVEANTAKTNFLAVMSHEFRTPLNAIAGYTELLRMGLRGPVTKEQIDDLERISRNQYILLSLINDILNYARLEAGRIQYTIERVHLHEVIADLEPLIFPQLHAKQLRFELASCPSELAVQADSDKVRQILINLLSNAIKFTPRRGSIVITCQKDESNARVVVEDTGPGIPAEKMQTIFEPFVQLDRNLTTVQEGSGLGLAISRDLARGMGGELHAESAVGKGSKFTLILPATVQPDSVANRA